MISYIKKKLFATNGSGSGSSPLDTAWTTWAFDAADYTANGGTFVAINDATYVNRYKVAGKTMFWQFHITGTTALAPSEIIIEFPNSYTTKSNILTNAVYFQEVDIATYPLVFSGTSASSNALIITRSDLTDFANGFTDISFTITFEIE